MTNPPAKRPARRVTRAHTAAAKQQPFANVLEKTAILGIMSDYLTVLDLVVLRAVSKWCCQQFSRARCWQYQMLRADQLQADCPIQMASLQCLPSLDLTCELSSQARCVDRVFELLSTSRMPKLNTLRLLHTITAAVLQACPNLTQLASHNSSARIPIRAMQHLSNQLQSLDIRGGVSDQAVQILIEQGVHQLRHCGILINVAPLLMQQFIASCPSLQSISVNSDGQPTHSLIKALVTCSKLEQVTTVNASGSVELLDALGELPQLKALTLTQCRASTPFWQKLAELRADGRLRLVHLSVVLGDYGNDSQYWVQVLHAATYCDNLTLPMSNIPDAAWDQYISEAHAPLSTSRLQQIVGGMCRNNRYLALYARHTHLTSLNCGTLKYTTKVQILECLTQLPHLLDLTLRSISPIELRKALVASGSLTQLQQLDYMPEPDEVEEFRTLANNDKAQRLSVAVQLVSEMTSLRQLTLSASPGAWDHAEIAHLKGCLRHVTDELRARITYYQWLDNKPARQTAAIAKLLRLANLTHFSCSQQPRWIDHEWLRKQRQTLGLNHVYT